MLSTASVRVEVHVSQLQDCARSDCGQLYTAQLVTSLPLTLCADHAGLEGPVGVDDVHEGSGLLGDDVLCQLWDGINIGSVNKPGACRVQSCFKIFLNKISKSEF